MKNLWILLLIPFLIGAAPDRRISDNDGHVLNINANGSISATVNITSGGGGITADTVTLENGEIIDNGTDGTVCLKGAGGTNNEDICFDLETGANRVFIKTTTGADNLEKTTSDSGSSSLQFTNSTTGLGSAGNNGVLVGMAAGEEGQIWQFENDDIRFATNNLQRLRIEEDGELWGDPFNDQQSYELAGAILDEITGDTVQQRPVGMWGWITPATTEQDLTIENHDATYQGSMTTGDQLNKGFVWSLDLDGAGDRLDVADHDDFSFGDSSNDFPFSVGWWIEVVDEAGSDRLLSKHDSATDEYVFQMQATEKLNVILNDEDVNETTSLIVDDALSQAWHFVVFTYDGTGGATALDSGNAVWYVDGVSVASTVTNNASYVSMVNTATEVTIFGKSNAATDTFEGDAGLFFMTKGELTAGQIWKMYVKSRGYYNL